jgi:ABC-type Na+ efflux pump permease subunit
MGASFAHVLELPAKLQLTGEQYLAVQSIYRYFGAIATVLETGSVVLMVGVLAHGWHRPSARLSGLALIAFVASLVAWFVIVSPVNAVFASWSSGPPVHWIAARDRWEWGHVTVFGLKLVAFLLLITAMLRSR